MSDNNLKSELNNANRELESKTLQSEKLKLLRDGPKTRDEVGKINSNRLRNIVAKIKLPKISVSTQGEGAANAKMIFYLYGDDRRAVRRFIKENFEFVENQMGKSHNTLRNNMDEILFKILCEEYQMMVEYDGVEHNE